MVSLLFQNLTQEDKSKAIERLISYSTPDQDFFYMITLAVLMATLGLILNSAAIIIGSMLIAPILYPVLGLALGIIMADFSLIQRAALTIAKSAAIGAITAALATIFFASKQTELNPEVLARTQITLSFLTVAIVAGLAASFAAVKPKLSETLPGIAISVALIPPLAVVGIGLARLNFEMARQALTLVSINILGIVFAAMINFSLMNFYLQRWVAVKTAKEEDEKIKKQQATVKLTAQMAPKQDQ